MYLQSSLRLVRNFKGFRLEEVPRAENEKTDALDKLSSQKEVVLLDVIPLKI